MSRSDHKHYVLFWQILQNFAPFVKWVIFIVLMIPGHLYGSSMTKYMDILPKKKKKLAKIAPKWPFLG